MGVTLKDIAVKAGVSRMAVSAVVNRTNSTRVSQEKRAHIARIAEEMGYMPNLTAQVLSGKSSRMVGILNASVRQYSLAVLVAQFLHNAARYKYQMLSDLYSQTRTVEEYREEVLNMLRRSPDGVIILGNPPPEVMEIIKIPNVIIQFQNDSTHRNGDLYYDHAAGGYMAGLHLLAHGHRKVVYVCSHIQNPPHDKFNGLQRAWGEAGLPDNHLQVIEAMHCEGTVEDRLLHLIHKEGYTCALMSNDFVAARALPFLRQNGIRVPEDFALIGYDGDAFAYLTDPPLSTISQVSEEICDRALKLLFERIRNKQIDCKEIRLGQSVKPAFFQGGSCGCACDLPPILGWTRDMLFLKERFSDRMIKYDDFINRHKRQNQAIKISTATC